MDSLSLVGIRGAGQVGQAGEKVDLNKVRLKVRQTRRDMGEDRQNMDVCDMEYTPDVQGGEAETQARLSIKLIFFRKDIYVSGF